MPTLPHRNRDWAASKPATTGNAAGSTICDRVAAINGCLHKRSLHRPTPARKLVSPNVLPSISSMVSATGKEGSRG